MFKKYPFLKIEFLPDGRKLFTGRIGKNTDPSIVANFVNETIIRKNLEDLLKYIYEISKKNNASDIGEEICERILHFQSTIDIKPSKSLGRNPKIKPSQVMRDGDGDE